MARMGKVSAGDLKKLQQELNKIEQKDVESFISACAKELAARLLAKVIKRTPVGDYSKEITVVAKKDSKHHKAGDTYTKRVNPSGKMGGAGLQQRMKKRQAVKAGAMPKPTPIRCRSITKETS